MEASCARIFERHRTTIHVQKADVAIANLVRIIDATLKLSNKKGFHATTVRELAKGSGLSTGGLYSYFDNKATLLSMILSEVGSIAAQVLRTAPNNLRGHPRAHLAWAIDTHIRLSEAMQPRFVFSFMEAKSFPQAERRIATDAEAATEEMFAEVIARGVASGDFTGREKDLIIRGGHNIDPTAIEDVANAFPGVQISAAVSMPDVYAGEAPMLFAAPAPGCVVDAEALKAHLAEHVLEPPARPKRVAILESLPVTAVGKIFKPALRDLAIRENALLEVLQIFGPLVEATVEVDRDEKLRTIVTIAVGSCDEALRARLKSELSKLPQIYVLLPTEEQEGGHGDDGNRRRSGHPDLGAPRGLERLIESHDAIARPSA